jgi:hypothetical protein
MERWQNRINFQQHDDGGGAVTGGLDKTTKNYTLTKAARDEEGKLLPECELNLIWCQAAQLIIDTQQPKNED